MESTTLASLIQIRKINGNGTLSSDIYDGQAMDVLRIVLESVSGVIIVCGLCGNVLTLVALNKVPKASAMTVFMMALAVIDFLFLLDLSLRFVIPELMWRSCLAYHRGCEEYSLYRYTRIKEYAQPLEFPCQMVESWMILCLTLDRYIAICRPHMFRYSTKKNAIKAVFVILVLTIIVNIPGYVALSKTGWGIQRIISNTIGYIIPLLLVTAFNIRLIVALIATRRRHRKLGSGGRAKPEVRCLAPIVTVVLIYWICQSPYFLDSVTRCYYWDMMKTSASFAHFQFILKPWFKITRRVLLIINSSVNVVIYFLLYKRFRCIVKEYMSCQ